MSALFSDFAAVADRIAATSRRSVKADLLCDYLATLDDVDLERATRFAAGRAFASHDQRTISIGGAAILAALEATSGVEPVTLREQLVELGDLGDVAGAVHRGASTGLTLRDVEHAFVELASTSGTKKRVAIVEELLRRASTGEARYVVKLMLGDLRIGLKEGGVEEGVAKLAEVKVAEIQRVSMLTGDIGETAVLARRGELGSAAMALFHPIGFMLATPAKDDDDVRRQMPDRFFVEDKFDGIRAQAHIAPDNGDDTLHGIVHDGVRVALFSRTLDAITAAFPELVTALAALSRGRSLILDGEIVPIAGEQILPFQSLQPRLGRKKLTDEMLRQMPVAYVIFDILYDEGELLLERPLAERRERLDALDVDNTTIRRALSTSAADPALLAEMFVAARERGNEGLMVKSPDSIYKPGRRGRDWLKVKQALGTLDVVVTAVEVGNGKRRHLLSDFTFAVRASESDPTLLNIGKAYSGLTDAELEELTTWFREHTLQEFAHGKVRIVEPSVVIEVAFDRVQPSARHKSGYALRFPRIVRVRDDKPPSEIDTLEAVRRVAEEGMRAEG